MLKALFKSVSIALLLLFLSSQAAHAQNKVYQYDGKLPFVQMMLNMMVAMGILDRLPANAAYNGFNNPMMGNNLSSPFRRSPWSQSPWTSSNYDDSNINAASPVWGSPSWGVLPSQSYASNNYSGYGRNDMSPPWSSNDLDGWVNETWETSSWNPDVDKTVRPAQPQPAPQANQPLVQNFNYNVPADQMAIRQNNNERNVSPLAKLAPQQSQKQQKPRISPLQKKSKNKIRQKPCVTDFCGLKKPSLDGLWVAKNGEMLGVKNHRYLWSDSSSRYLTGQLKIQNEYLLANVDGYDQLMQFKYKLAGNYLLTLQPNGEVREFVRMRNNQYQGANYDPRYNNGKYYQ